MTSIHVHVHANLGELGQGVVGTVEVGRLGVGALLDVQVGNQVGERVGLNHSDDTDLRVFCSDDKVYVPA